MGACASAGRPRTLLSDHRWQAYSCLSVGADSQVQELPGDDSAAQDQMALQEGQQARPAQGRAERRPEPVRVQHLERRGCSDAGRQRGAAARVRQKDRRGHDVAFWSYMRVLHVALNEDGGHPARRKGRTTRRHNDGGRGRGPEGKEYRLPTKRRNRTARSGALKRIDQCLLQSSLSEFQTSQSKRRQRRSRGHFPVGWLWFRHDGASCSHPRQLLAIGTFVEAYA